MVRICRLARAGHWNIRLSQADEIGKLVFGFFNEVGIINQLATRQLESKLPGGLLISHFGVINHLMRLGDGRTPLQIATAHQVPKTTMTHTLAGLKKAGLIEFAPNPKDARSKCVMLTDAGRRFHAEAIAAIMPEFQALLGDIPADQFAAALPFLQRVRAYMDAARD